MKFEQIQYLISLANTHSMNKTAQQMFISQSSISKQIKALENELGFDILNRSRKGISFTQQGIEFLRDAYALADQMNLMTEKYMRNEDRPFHFSVFAQHYIFTLMSIVEMINANDQRIFELEFRDGKTLDIIKSVASQKSDIGIIYYSGMNKKFIQKHLKLHKLEFHALCRSMPHAYISKNHPLAHQTILSMKDLEPYPYLSYSIDTDHNSFAEEVIAPEHISKHVIITDRHALYNIIAHTNTYSCGSGFLTSGYTDENVISVPLALGNDYQMTIGWIVPSWQNINPLTVKFVELCRQMILSSDSADLMPLIE